jgi:hypothetical protein
MPKYIDPKDLNTFGQIPKDDGLTQLDKINNMLDKGLKIFDKISSLRKYKAEQDNKGMNNNQIEIKANKEAERIVKLQAPPTNLNVQTEPTPQTQTQPPKEYEINYKVDEAVKEFEKFISKIKDKDKEKKVKELIEVDLKKWKEAGLVNVFIEAMLKDYTELKEK